MELGQQVTLGCIKQRPQRFEGPHPLEQLTVHAELCIEPRQMRESQHAETVGRATDRRRSREPDEADEREAVVEAHAGADEESVMPIDGRSLSDSDGNNLLEPGETPQENAQFLVFCTAVIRAVNILRDEQLATPVLVGDRLIVGSSNSLAMAWSTVR